MERTYRAYRAHASYGPIVLRRALPDGDMSGYPSPELACRALHAEECGKLHEARALVRDLERRVAACEVAIATEVELSATKGA